MDPLTYFLIWLGTTILTAMLTPKPDFDPASEEDISLPTVSQSRRIPLVIGQGLVTGPNVLDKGNLFTHAIRVSGGLFKGKVDSGIFRYYMDMFFSIAWGPGELLGVKMGDHDLGLTPMTGTAEEVISLANLWGDDSTGGGGGFVGKVRFNAGVDAGIIDTTVEARVGNIQPGYPNVATVLLWHDWKRGGAYMGNNPTFKGVKFHYAYYPNPLSAVDHKINGHANVAYFLHDLNKDPQWGRDIGGTIDLTAISAMAATLATEGLGWSRTFYNGDAAAMEAEALEYVSGVRTRNPLTGQITYKLLRDDFVVGNLLSLGDNEIIDLYIDGSSLSVTATEVAVTYVDIAEGFKRKTITRTNVAARTQLGRRVPMALDYLGAPDGAIADKIATREARKLTVPKRRGKLWCSREAWDWSTGEAFIINWSPEGMSGVIARIVNINRGNILDVNGRVEIDWLEIPFDYGTGVFGDVGSTPTVPLTGVPADVTEFFAFELPDFATASPHKLGLFAVDPVGDSYGFDWQIDSASGGTWFVDSDGQFTTPSDVSTTYNEQAVTLILDGWIDAQSHTWADIAANGYNLVLLDTANGQEWIAFTGAAYNDTTDETTLTGVKRGLFDTYPKEMVATDAAWLLDEANVSDHTFGATDDADFRLIDKTAQGSLAEGSATVRDFVFNNRHGRPFLPGNIKIDSVLFPASVTGPLTASWAHRDKTGGALRDWFDTTSYGPESGVTYKVEWYNDDTSALLQTTSGITGTSDTWTDTGNSYNVRLEITAQRGGVDSFETFVFVTAFSQP
ncbi:MAG: hypothetical protein AB9Q22_10260 [Candidatus Reddybacter sp.]